ncbi:hypothetical protein MVEN_00131700 [Mycena venus]|uniref:Transposase n=1 Tax=Mycena venus TaxID=2733690 RepID=A0A8H7DEP3_9AGAR|nr:hypothetical protein MVEN_00131700 [Mycena venus]
MSRSLTLTPRTHAPARSPPAPICCAPHPDTCPLATPNFPVVRYLLLSLFPALEKFPYIPLDLVTLHPHITSVEYCRVAYRARYNNRRNSINQSIKLPSADGSRFFFPTEEEVATGELRIGVTMGMDWFSYLRSQISAFHSSCPISYSVINLLAHHRYRTAHFLLAGIMPGPKEATPDQCQRFLRPIINELLRLWKEGVVIVTPKYPKGRLIRVALVAVVCDKPAAYKIGGFGSHSHTHFCTLCWICQDLKSTPEAFKENGFPERTNKRHRELQKEYLKCTTKSARDAFVKQYATRWCELHRLPYFNICEMIVIDPMHNLFLGVVKTHFYHIWVQLNVLRKTKELRSLHAILAKLKLPAHLGRLLSLIGEPAGGTPKHCRRSRAMDRRIENIQVLAVGRINRSEVIV